MGFSRQQYWSGLPFPSPGDLPNPGIEPRSPALQVDSLPAGPPGNVFFILPKSWINPNVLGLGGVRELMMDTEAGCAEVYGVAKSHA